VGPAGIIDYHYDENNYKGNLTSVHYANGTYTTYGYDNRNRLVSLTNNGPGGIISQYTYTLDGVGNKINVSFEEPLSRALPLGTTGYDYITGNFLTSAGTATYQYDPTATSTRRQKIALRRPMPLTLRIDSPMFRLLLSTFSTNMMDSLTG
jgi:YD repeat-containing protein